MEDKSMEYNGADAIEMIQASDNVDEIKSFTEGDERKGVLAAAEKRIAALTEPPPKALEIASCDTWRYHPEQEPRIFRKGEEIPEEWSDLSASKLWTRSIDGKWSKVEVTK